MPTDDEKICQLIKASPVGSVDDVIAILRGLDNELDTDDGLKWFNLLYLKVTEGVRAKPPTVQWENGRWLDQLDVEFAKLYVAALSDWNNNRANVARAWQPLFQSRTRRGLKRLQFALAGINAHINHDLPVALVRTCKSLRITLRRDSKEHRDYQRVNAILEVAQEDAKRYIATGVIGLLDESLGDLDDHAAAWGVRKARETAWSNGELLWRLNRVPSLRDDFLVNLDRLVGLASRGLLVPALTA
jgi:hypothetical protein